jgi:hypothetical protein
MTKKMHVHTGWIKTDSARRPHSTVGRMTEATNTLTRAGFGGGVIDVFGQCHHSRGSSLMPSGIGESI